MYHKEKAQVNILYQAAHATGKNTMDIVEDAILKELEQDLYPYVDEYRVHRNCTAGNVPSFVTRHCQKLLATTAPELPLGLA